MSDNKKHEASRQPTDKSAKNRERLNEHIKTINSKAKVVGLGKRRRLPS